MMEFHEKRLAFERNIHSVESVKLHFYGVDSYDVYNCSVPFIVNGEEYIFGRVEKREEWARSWVRLFKKTEEDGYTVCDNGMIYQMEDPFISSIGGKLILGGVHVPYHQFKPQTYMTYFYGGDNLMNLYMFTHGPECMKDIRLVELEDGIGVFSRPRGEAIRRAYGSESVTGFTKIRSLEELSTEVIENAKPISGMFGHGEWGGPNQCITLDGGLIGIIGHKSYKYKLDDGFLQPVYLNVAWVFDPKTHQIHGEKIIATRSSYPDGPFKVRNTADCAFTSGVTLRADGRLNLYSGIGDAEEARTVIDNPFGGYGKLRLNNEFHM